MVSKPAERFVARMPCTANLDAFKSDAFKAATTPSVNCRDVDWSISAPAGQRAGEFVEGDELLLRDVDWHRVPFAIWSKPLRGDATRRRHIALNRQQIGFWLGRPACPDEFVATVRRDRDLVPVQQIVQLTDACVN